MAVRRPVVLVGGRLKELPLSDSLPGGGGGGSGVSVYSVEVDFGAAATRSQTFYVPLPGATVGKHVLAVPSLDMPAGVAWDELELDPLVCAAKVVEADLLLVLVSSTGGPVSGKRNINITLE